MSTGDVLAARFDPRRNSIGAFRLVLALVVVVSHAWPLGGFGTDPGRGDNNLGILAVEGFFALSGFLIARSALQSPSIGRFLWHRALRIFPGFWVSLVVVAFAFAPVAAWLRGVSFDAGSASGYVINNAALRITQTGIDGTLAGPFGSLWNGPLYTLAFEFACYLLVAALAATRLLRLPVVAALAVGVWLYLQAAQIGLVVTDDRQARFTLAFLIGALLVMAGRRIPTRGPAVVTAATVAVTSYVVGGFATVGLPAFAYLVVVAAVVAPWHRLGVKRDLSYGVYVYAWPVAQVLALIGATRWGLAGYLAATVAATLPLAVASWYAVESPALRLKSVRKRQDDAGAVTVPVASLTVPPTVHETPPVKFRVAPEAATSPS